MEQYKNTKPLFAIVGMAKTKKMETLTITEILEFYDFPQLFWAKDNKNEPYLCLCYEIDKGGSLLCIAAKQPNNSKDLVSILKNAEVCHSLYTVKMLDDDNIVAQPYTGELVENMLPKGEYRMAV